VSSPFFITSFRVLLGLALVDYPGVDGLAYYEDDEPPGRVSCDSETLDFNVRRSNHWVGNVSDVHALLTSFVCDIVTPVSG